MSRMIIDWAIIIWYRINNFGPAKQSTQVKDLFKFINTTKSRRETICKGKKNLARNIFNHMHVNNINNNTNTHIFA